MDSLLTDVFTPFSESVSHFKKSPEGAMGSSTLRAGASLMAVGTAGGLFSAVLPFRETTGAVDGIAEVAIVAATFAGAALAGAGRVAAAVAVFVFPLEPTVDQAPPTCGCTVICCPA